YYWFPKMTGRMYDERLGKLHFWLTFVGFNLTFFPMHLIGVQGMPRRVADYAPRFADWNLFISIASFGLGASTIVFLYNMIHSWRFGPVASGNPWRALTLEWQVSSPPPIFNFDEIPQVVGSPYEYGVPGARHAVLNGDRAAAGRRLDKTLGFLREAGIPAHGLVVDADPVSAVRDAIAQLEPDAIVVSTHPETRSGWLRRDVVERIRSTAGPIPVEHVVADMEREEGSEANVLVVANETVIG